MIKKIIMPKLGETMEEGIITRWIKKEGDKVEKGQPLFEVMTDKANFEVESTAEGFLRKILIPASEKPVPVIKTIGYIADSMDEEIPEIEQQTTAVNDIQKTTETTVDVKPAPTIDFSGIKASPLAKKLAIEKGVDLRKIKGSGPGGRIVEKDILEALSSEKIEEQIIPLTGIRKIIAQRLSKSKQEIPHYYLQTEIDMTEVAKIKSEDISFNDIIINAVAKTLEEFPKINAIFEEDKIKINKKINIGVAVSLEEGLIVPVIKDANTKSVKEISSIMREIKNKAKTNRFTPEELSDGTFTISNLGMYNIDVFSAIINPPQVGIAAFGRIKEVPTVVNGEITIRKMMKVCMSFDHRVVDGAEGAKFLSRLKEILENIKSEK